LKLGFVVQRYGLEIAGGAEYHCRLVAEHLARHAQVEVLTTCARDYVSWADHYPAGEERLNGVTVRRHPVQRPRDRYAFRDWSARVMNGPHSREDELRWLDEEGPLSPALAAQVAARRDAYDALICFSYRYWTTWHALRALPGRALLVPTAEDDGIYRLEIFRELFAQPRAIVWNSLEEKAMIERSHGPSRVPGDVVGVGSALPASVDAARFRSRHGIEGPFALYVGRIDANKGCPELFEWFLRHRAQTGSELRLVTIGEPLVPIPEDPGIVPLGFLPDQDKWDALDACELLVMPSRYESLSMVTLEAFWARRPVLANARAEVLRGQCRRAQAGLYYATEDEFHEALALLEAQPGLRAALGENGRRYFEANYAWDVIERKYLELLRPLVAAERWAS
jgi:glycosyltransferase involved in cell wall biosynthesis